MDVMLTRIQRQATAQTMRTTQHAQIEMDAEEITLDEVLATIAVGQILEITLSIDVANVVYSMVVHPKDVIYTLSVLQHNQC